MASRIVVVVVLLLQTFQRASALKWGDPCSTPGRALGTGDGRVAAFCTASRTWVVTGAGEDSAKTRAGRTEGECASRPGELVCSDDCVSVGVCLAGAGWVHWYDCGKGKVCEEGVQGTECVDTYDGFTCAAEDILEAQCGAAGRYYPVIGDCTSYLDCSEGGANSEVRKCPEGTAFDACTSECDVAISGNKCSWDSEAGGARCTQAGDWGPAPNNDRLFYLCANDPLVAFWWQCSTGHFDPARGGCVDTEVPGCGCGESGSSSSSPTDATPTAGTSSTTTAPATPECLEPGPMKNPATNCSFFYCLQIGEDPIVVNCDPVHYYNGTGCVPGSCF